MDRRRGADTVGPVAVRGFRQAQASARPLGAMAAVLAAALVSSACSAGAGTVAPAPHTMSSSAFGAGSASAEAPPAVQVEPAPRSIGVTDTLPKENPGGYPTANSEFGRLTDVRVAPQDGFDRIVLEFDSDSVPAWRVAYVAPPVTTAESGEVVPVDGAAFLQLSVAPAGALPLPGAPAGPRYGGPDRIALPDGASVRELVEIGDWEGTLAWTAGTSGELPFAVAALERPARLVIDVAHPR